MHALATVIGVLTMMTAQAAKAPPATVTISGCLVSLKEEAQVPAREAGFLAELGAVEGQQVANGDLLGRIDASQAESDRKIAGFEWQAADAEAKSMVNVKYAEATCDVALADWKRGVEANKRSAHALPDTEIDKLRLTYTQTNIAIEKAKNDLAISGFKAQVSGAKRDAADEAIDRRQIRAPLDGEVVELRKHAGEWVQAGEVVAHVVRLDRLRIEGFLSAADYEHAELAGREVTATVQFARGHRETFSGTVVFVDPLVQARGRFRVRAEVANRKLNGHWLLLPGLTAEMTIQLK